LNRATQASDVLAKCPDTKLIMSGYSQGCQIVHNAVEQLPAATASKISSVLLFGDPCKIPLDADSR
jgi:type IV secretory pathway VirJ component